MSGGTFAVLLLGVVAVIFNAAILKKLSDDVVLNKHTTATSQCGIDMTDKHTNTGTTHLQRPHAEPTGVFESKR